MAWMLAHHLEGQCPKNCCKKSKMQPLKAAFNKMPVIETTCILLLVRLKFCLCSGNYFF
jgi:hypothetical protein